MRSINLLIYLFAGLMLLFTLESCGSKTQTKLNIAAAANTQYALSEIVELFEAKTKIECELITGSSGKLTAQIQEGAPYHVFLSADMKYPIILHQKGMTQDPPKVFGVGHLVLWSLTESVEPSFAVLFDENIKHIALANPVTAPYGQAAAQVLKKIDQNDQLQSKYVYGESISQTNLFLSSESAEIGFTAKSVVLSPNIPKPGKWIECPSDHYDPIEQGIVVLNQDSSKAKEAKLFFDFIFSSEAQKVLKDYGYSVNE